MNLGKKEGIVVVGEIQKREIMPLTLELSEMIEVTLDQFGPTEVMRPTRPPPAITFISSASPSLDPLSITKEEYQLPESLLMIRAPILL